MVRTEIEQKQQHDHISFGNLGNTIGDEGTKVMSDVMKLNTTMKTLDLSSEE